MLTHLVKGFYSENEFLSLNNKYMCNIHPVQVFDIRERDQGAGSLSSGEGGGELCLAPLSHTPGSSGMPGCTVV